MLLSQCMLHLQRLYHVILYSLRQFDSVSIENTDSTVAAASDSPKTLRFARCLPYKVCILSEAYCLKSKINWVEKLNSVPGQMSGTDRAESTGI